MIVLLYFTVFLLKYSESNKIVDVLQELTPQKVYDHLAKSSSSNCQKAITQVIKSWNDFSDENELRMLDACGKFGSGILTGNVHAYGTFDECLPIRDKEKEGIPSYSGQYVLVTLTIKDPINSSVVSNRIKFRHMDYGIDWTKWNITSTSIQDTIIALLSQPPVLGLCVPSLCSVNDIESGLRNLSQVILSEELNFDIGNNIYSEKELSIKPLEILALLLVSLLLLLVCVGSVLENYASNSEIYKSKLIQFLHCFSLLRNTRQLFKVSKEHNYIQCLNGIRALSMMWIIAGHTWLYFGQLNNSPNAFDQLDFFNQLSSLLIISSRYGVDTFFLIGGFLISYLQFKRLDKTNGKFNFFLLIVHRLIRLSPLYTFNILFYMTAFPLLGNGPHWSFVENLSKYCIDNWWTNLLYINNFVNVDRICLRVSWYLASDFQYFIISPIVIWIAWKLKKFAIVFLFFVLGCSCFIPGLLTALNNWPPLVSLTIGPQSWTDSFYFQSYTRAPPYIFGLLFGYLMYKFPQVKKFNQQYIILLGWLLFIGTMLACILGIYPYVKIDASCLTRQCHSTVVSTLYAAFARLAWSLCIAWLIFTCISGNSGLLNDFLSSSIFSLLNKLSYAMYLSHTHFILSYLASQKIPQYFSDYHMIVLTSGFVLLTMCLSIPMSIVFEVPFIGLEKLLFGTQQKV